MKILNIKSVATGLTVFLAVMAVPLAGAQVVPVGEVSESARCLRAGQLDTMAREELRLRAAREMRVGRVKELAVTVESERHGMVAPTTHPEMRRIHLRRYEYERGVVRDLDERLAQLDAQRVAVKGLPACSAEVTVAMARASGLRADSLLESTSAADSEESPSTAGRVE